MKMDNLPQNPIMLMSVINTWLRDSYSSLDQLCEDRGIDRRSLEEKLADAGFTYLPIPNQFR